MSACGRSGYRSDAGGARRGVRRGALALLAAALLGACSSTEEFLSGQPPPPSGTSASVADRFRSLFGASPAAEPAPKPAAAPGAAGTVEVNCPPIDIRQGASTLQTTAPGADQAMAVRYQATFVRTARQCAAKDGVLNVKIGVQGRLILGPAGAPGDTTVPLRYALVQEGVEPKTIWSKLYNVPVTVPPDLSNVPFTQVVEDMSVPLPPGRELDRYVIYVGFDPQGAAQEKAQQKKPPRGR